MPLFISPSPLPSFFRERAEQIFLALLVTSRAKKFCSALFLKREGNRARKILFGPISEEGGKQGQKNFVRPYLSPSSEIGPNKIFLVLEVTSRAKKNFVLPSC